GATFVHAFEDEAAVAGQGTLGLELGEQLAEGATLGVPIGGGGLGGGIALALRELRPEIHLVGVQAANCAPFVGLAPSGITIADGMAVEHAAELYSGNID